ncbi:unnamed protein product, partial [Amoebophrya sp. A25]
GSLRGLLRNAFRHAYLLQSTGQNGDEPSLDASITAEDENGAVYADLDFLWREPQSALKPHADVLRINQALPDAKQRNDINSRDRAGFMELIFPGLGRGRGSGEGVVGDELQPRLYNNYITDDDFFAAQARRASAGIDEAVRRDGEHNKGAATSSKQKGSVSRRSFRVMLDTLLLPPGGAEH